MATLAFKHQEQSEHVGIKSPSKLLSPKYQSQSSLEEQNRNPSSPKHVYFINSIIILRKEDEPEQEEEIIEPNATKDNDCNISVEVEEEVKEESEESNEETKDETKRKIRMTQNTSTPSPRKKS
ncbi:hypothetical protein Tco_0504661 [Tanacetum coccineum]